MVSMDNQHIDLDLQQTIKKMYEVIEIQDRASSNRTTAGMSLANAIAPATTIRPPQDVNAQPSRNPMPPGNGTGRESLNQTMHF